MVRRVRWHLVLLLTGMLTGLAVPSQGAAAQAPAATQAQEAPGVTLTARGGFDGYYKDQMWVPVRITVANDGPDVSGTLRIVSPRDYGNAETIFTRAVELPTQSRREIFLYVAPEGSVTSLKVELLDNKGKPVTSMSVRMVQASAADLIYGILAGSPSAFSGLASADPVSGSAFVAQLEPGDLPPIVKGWEALDVLVVSDVDTGVFTPEQRAALAGWIAGGGRLIVAGGPSWQKTAAGLSEVLPVSPSGTRPLTELGPLAAFSAAATPEGSAIIAQGTLAPDATVLASAEGTPLIVSRQSGFGQVTFLAADPAFAPLRGWDGFEGLFRNILAVPSDRPAWAKGFHNWSSAEQAVNALPNLQLPSTFEICGFLLVYLIAIGPLNYLVLRRLRRRELAWVTIPGVVLVFSAATYVTGYQLRGVQATLHQLTFVQVWTDSDRAQVDQLVGVFSPRRATYDLQFAPGFLARPIPTTGSFSSTPGSITLEQGDSTLLPDLNTDVAAVEAFVAQGQMPAPRFQSNLVLEVASSTIRLTGTVTNLSDLTLEDVVLLGPGGPSGVQRLGELKPGQTQNVSLVLYTSRAALAPVNIVAPAVFHAGSGTPVTASYYPPSAYDTTVDDILGNSNYYADREEFRRYSLLTTAIDTYGGVGRGNGVYLVGWTSTAPVSAKVVNRSFGTLDSTLYIISLRPTFNLGEETLTVPPGLMTWTVLDPGQAGSPTPYDMYIYPGYDSYALRFAPAQSLRFSQVKQLTLHLASYGMTGAADLEVDVWDFTENTWARQPALVWGDNDLLSPARFVGPGGEVQVRVSLPNAAPQVNLEALDFTLVVDP